MNPERAFDIEYGPEVRSPSGKARRTVSKVATTPQGTRSVIGSKVQRWKWTPVADETASKKASRNRVKRQSLARVLKDLGCKEEAVQEVPSVPPAPCATVSHAPMPLLQVIDDPEDQRPDLPADLPRDFAFDVDLLEARRDWLGFGKVSWEDVREQLVERCWNVGHLLGSDDAAVQRYVLQQRAQKLVRGLYLAGWMSSQLLPARQGAAVAAGMRACVERAA